MMNVSSQVAGNINSLPDPGIVARVSRKTHKPATTVLVPCRPLSSMMNDSGYTMLHFASIDVQGAELAVLRTLDPRQISVLLVEAEGTDQRSQKRIQALHRYLEGYGFAHHNLHLPSTRPYHGGYNELFVRSDLHQLANLRPSQVHGIHAGCNASQSINCWSAYHLRNRETRIAEALQDHMCIK